MYLTFDRDQKAPSNVLSLYNDFYLVNVVDHSLLRISSTHTHTHTHTQGRLTRGIHGFADNDNNVYVVNVVVRHTVTKVIYINKYVYIHVCV